MVSTDVSHDFLIAGCNIQRLYVGCRNSGVLWDAGQYCNTGIIIDII